MTMEVERPAVAGAPSPVGLSTAEAQRRLAVRGPLPALPSSRSYGSIVRANVFTVFNLILAVFGALTLLYADWRDALFLGVLISNSAIGITQEVRAKRASTGLPRSSNRRRPSCETDGREGCTSRSWSSETSSGLRPATRWSPTVGS